MILAVQQGEVAGKIMIFLFVAAIIGIPISVAIVKNRRYAAASAEAARYAHMEGWVAGTPAGQSGVTMLQAPPSRFGTAGPRVISEGGVGTRKWVQIVAGPPPVRRELQPTAPLIVLPDKPAKRDESSRSRNQPASRSGTSEGDHSEASAASASRPEVLMMGPPEVIGWNAESDRLRATELACFLSLHERNMMAEEIRAALWPGDLETGEGSPKSLRNSISNLRSSLGREHVPEAFKGTGYGLVGVSSDWTRFQELVARAGADYGGQADLLSEALDLVRGAPFAGVAAGTYTWAWTELFVARMEKAITDAAHRLAAMKLASSNTEAARTAAMKGLTASPYDRNLWSDMLHAAALNGTAALDKEWKNIESVLGADAADLRPLYEELRQSCG